jgi:predicted transcriptional regulator
VNRRRKDFSQGEAAVKLQISKRTLQEWEQGACSAKASGAERDQFVDQIASLTIRFVPDGDCKLRHIFGRVRDGYVNHV